MAEHKTKPRSSSLFQDTEFSKRAGGETEQPESKNPRARTLELVEADGGVEHAHGPRPLGEVAVVGVVQRRLHEIPDLRGRLPSQSSSPQQEISECPEMPRRLPERACHRRRCLTRIEPPEPTAPRAGAPGRLPGTPAPWRSRSVSLRRRRFWTFSEQK